MGSYESSSGGCIGVPEGLYRGIHRYIRFRVHVPATCKILSISETVAQYQEL